MPDSSTPAATPASADPGDALRPQFDLGTDGLVSQGVQNVKDAAGNSSALSVGTSFVGIGTTGAPAPGIALQVDGPAEFNPLAVFRNTSPTTTGEASIRLVHQTAEDKGWNIGVWGDGTLFLWNGVSDVALAIDSSGNVSIKNGTLAISDIPPARGGFFSQVLVDMNTGILHRGPLLPDQ
ncbi:MAG TPA: hypothetical protein VF615_28995 [Longimicrobiaceae bacterium]|jgi:hypothetical protein